MIHACTSRHSSIIAGIKGGFRTLTGFTIVPRSWPVCPGETTAYAELQERRRVKVIGAGFPRTGTSSLKAALERLDFGPCYHMFELLRHPHQVDLWQRMDAGEPVGWNQVFDGYHSALDWPASYFWRELAHAYPEARVILTVRDPHRWYASITRPLIRGFPRQAETGSPPDPLSPLATLHPLLRRIADETFGPATPLPEEAQAIAAFQRHTAEVQRGLTAARLLTFDVSQGWEPLCEFLGVDPPPGEPFPHLNDSESARQVYHRVQTRGGLATPFHSTD